MINFIQIFYYFFLHSGAFRYDLQILHQIIAISILHLIDDVQNLSDSSDNLGDVWSIAITSSKRSTTSGKWTLNWIFAVLKAFFKFDDFCHLSRDALYFLQFCTNFINLLIFILKAFIGDNRRSFLEKLFKAIVFLCFFFNLRKQQSSRWPTREREPCASWLLCWLWQSEYNLMV